MARPAGKWRETIGRWLDEPTDEAVMAISVLLDGRAIHGPSHAFGVLSAVRDLAPVAQADLGRGVGLDPKDLVGVLNDLQSAGLVVREPDAKDRRKNAVSLTTEGARLLKRCEKAARAANEQLLAPLSEAERDEFMGLLIRISGTDG